MELSNKFPDSSLLDENNASGFPDARALEMNLISSSLFQIDQLEYVVHLPLSSVLFLLLVSLKLWVVFRRTIIFSSPMYIQR